MAQKKIVRELIPVNAVYAIKKTGEKLVGDGKSVYFPQRAAKGDTYVDKDYTYSYKKPGYGHDWSAVATDKAQPSYGPIRSCICGKNVTKLENAFRDCANMTESPIIPDNITDMGRTFWGCTSLIKAPTIPAGVTDMRGAFYGCASLVEAPAIPDSVTRIDNTFQGCTSLKSYAGSADLDGDFSKFKIPAGVKDMWSTFEGCGSLVKAPEIPSGVRVMFCTFHDCESLVSAPVLPDNVMSLYGTFHGCVSLKSYAGSTDTGGDFSKFRIPAGVGIMQSAFRDCKSLVTAPVIHGNIIEMLWAFSGCTSLTGTLVCHANPANYRDALNGTKITAIEGSCSEKTKHTLLATK